MYTYLGKKFKSLVVVAQSAKDFDLWTRAIRKLVVLNRNLHKNREGQIVQKSNRVAPKPQPGMKMFYTKIKLFRYACV